MSLYKDFVRQKEESLNEGLREKAGATNMNEGNECTKIAGNSDGSLGSSEN